MDLRQESDRISAFFFIGYVYKTIVCFCAATRLGSEPLYFNVVYAFIVVQLVCMMLSNSMYFGLKKKSYRIIKSWFHVEMLSLIIHFFVCSILKASFVVNDAAYGLGIPQKAMLLMTIDLNFLVEATVFCAVIWKVKDFENDEVGRRPPVSTGEGNVVVGLTTEPVEECHGSENDNARARSQYFILESPTAVVADDGDKLPTYDECINNQSEAIDPPRYEEISDIV